MTTRKEERDRLRQERLAAQQAASASERRRLMAGYVVAGLIVVAIVVGIVVAVTSGGDENDPQIPKVEGDVENAHIEPLSGSVNDFTPDTREGTTPPELTDGDLERSARDAGCDLQQDLPEEGNTHFGPNADPPEYKTNPATTGDHIEPPLQQADGAYTDEVEAKYVVHALEHGRVAIQYSPDLPEDDQLVLKGLFDESPDGMLLFPNSEMPYEVAAAAWSGSGGQLIGCESFEGQATIDALRNFRDIYRGQGPEPVPITLSG
jgi:hypothetical protein